MAKASELMTVQQVAALLNVTRRTVWRLVKSGHLPQPLRVSPRLRRWPRAAVLERIGYRP
jgi:excisionase family DNA binding protein